MKSSKLSLVCFCSALFAAQAWAASQKNAPQEAAPLQIEARIIQLEDERNLNGNELTGLLKHRNAAVRERAALAIGRIGDKRGTDALIALLEHDQSGKVRAITVFALGEMEDAQAVSLLMAVLEREKESLIVRARAAEALGKILSIPASADALGKPAVERINQSLIAQLPDPTDALTPDQKLIASLTISALMRIRSAASVEPLARQLKSKDADIRAQAANALARLRQPIISAVPALIEALQDYETSAVAKLTAAMEANYSDPRINVPANAARALGVSKDARAVEPLLKLLDDQSEQTQVNAVRALAAIGDRRVVEPLIELAKLNDPKAMLHRRRPPRFNLMLESVAALGLLKDERALSLLRRLAEVDGVGAHLEVAVALARFGEDEIIPAFEKTRLWNGDAKQVRNFVQALAEVGTERARELLLMAAGAGTRVDGVDDEVLPEILRALAKLKVKTLPFILQHFVKSGDVIVRATAASLIADLQSDESLWALIAAFKQTESDRANDAKLAILTALSKYKKPEAIEVIKLARTDRDHLVRRHAVGLLRQMDAGDHDSFIGNVQTNHNKAFYQRIAQRLNKKVIATIHTGKGRIKLELFPQDAPGAVDSFITLARKGFYNNLTFHRVVPNFVIQGGDPRGDGEGGPGYQIRCEINPRPYTRGAVGMALSGKDTGGSQFFITHSPQPHLDGGYTVFGQVVSGMEVVDRIVRGDVIKQVEIVEKRLNRVAMTNVSATEIPIGQHQNIRRRRDGIESAADFALDPDGRHNQGFSPGERRDARFERR